jgi:hypothetical protein
MNDDTKLQKSIHVQPQHAAIAAACVEDAE